MHWAFWRRVRPSDENDPAVWERLDEDEHNVLFQVTTKRYGTIRYWVPKRPIEFPPRR